MLFRSALSGEYENFANKLNGESCREAKTDGSRGKMCIRDRVGCYVPGCNPSEDELCNFSHGSGGCNIGLSGDSADDQRQEKGYDYRDAAPPVRNVK